MGNQSSIQEQIIINNAMQCSVLCGWGYTWGECTKKLLSSIPYPTRILKYKNEYYVTFNKENKYYIGKMHVQRFGMEMPFNPSLKLIQVYKLTLLKHSKKPTIKDLERRVKKIAKGIAALRKINSN